MAAPVPYLQKTMKFVRELGYTCEKTEQKIGNPKQKFMLSRDLYGFMDALAFSSKSGKVIGVQATSAGCISAHKKKYRDDKEVEARMWEWLQIPCCEIWMTGWKKVNNRWKVDVYYALPTEHGKIAWVKEGHDV